MSGPWRVRSGVGAAVAAFAFSGALACSGAGNAGLLMPPPSSTSPVEVDEASAPMQHGGGHAASTDDADAIDANSVASGDDASQSDDSDDASHADDAATPPPGAEPASPCPACALGTTCCAKAGSAQYGMCYSAILCLGLCCN
jgi:hypothetical protein